MRGFLQHRFLAPLLALMQTGVTARKLAQSVAMGTTIGLIPVLGVSTALCALAALWFRLNMPAIQLVNYLLTPLQLLLIIPLLRLGELLAGAPAFPVTLESGLALLSHGALNAIQVLAVAIAHATLGWLVLAPLAGLALFQLLEPAFRRLAPTTAAGIP